MQKLELNFRFSTNPIDQNSSKYRLYALDTLKWEFAKKISELVLDAGREATICFSKFHIQEIPETHYESTLRAQIMYDFARELPVIIHNGFEFRGIPIKAPEELTFWERVRFIFTSKYPR